ncbi:MAG: tetratricopeptide repeat protein [Deltaproteobacteria bacterium]|nr:tetratricopeptide repeat protein [Deltaproteobacteria bacterium]
MIRTRLALSSVIALAACPASPFEEAERLEKADQTREAAAAFRAIAGSDPANLAAWDRAVALYCRKLIDVGECTKTLDLELRLLGKLDRHREVLSEVLEERARARLDEGLAKTALMDLERAMQAGPGRASVHSARAKVYLSLGEWEMAQQALEKARALDPNHAESQELIKLLPPESSTRAVGAEEDAPFGGR